MNKAEFMNRVRSLYCIDGWQLPELAERDQQQFMRDPVRYMISTDDRESSAIWREIERRQK